MTQSGNNLILEWVSMNPDINKYINFVVPKEYVGDMRSFLIMEVNKIRRDKLDKMYNNNTLKYFTFKIIKNQMSPKCDNCFYKFYIKPSKVSDEFNVDIYKLVDNDLVVDNDDRLESIDNILRGMKPWKVSLFDLHYKEGFTFKEISMKVSMNIKTVQSWVYQVRDELREKLNK